MDCRTTQLKLIYYIDEKNNCNDVVEIEKHLASCKDCEEKAHNLKRLLGLIDTMKLQKDDEEFFDKIMVKYQQPKISKKPIRIKLARTISAAAIFIVTISFGVLAGYVSSNQLLTTESLQQKSKKISSDELAFYVDNSFSLLEESSSAE